MSDLTVAAIFTLLGTALGSIVAAITAWLTYRSRYRELSGKMMELAVGLLTQEPKASTMPLREWAIRVLDHYAKEKLGAEARTALLCNALTESPGLTATSPSKEHQG